MPINQGDRENSLRLLNLMADQRASAVVRGKDRDEYSMPIVMYGCVGTSVPGPCPIDSTFHCELDIGHVGLLIEYIGARRCLGRCDLRILSPGYVFAESGKADHQIQVYPSAWQPTRVPKTSWLSWLVGPDPNPQIIPPKVVRLQSTTGAPIKVTPEIEFKLGIQYEECVAPSQSLLSRSLAEPLPDSSSDSLRILKQTLSSVTVT